MRSHGTLYIKDNTSIETCIVTIERQNKCLSQERLTLEIALCFHLPESLHFMFMSFRSWFINKFLEVPSRRPFSEQTFIIRPYVSSIRMQPPKCLFRIDQYLFIDACIYLSRILLTFQVAFVIVLKTLFFLCAPVFSNNELIELIIYVSKIVE